MRDIVLREVPGYGWLPILQVDGKETYRGEFRKSPAEALESAEEVLWRDNLNPVFAGICAGLMGQAS